MDNTGLKTTQQIDLTCEKDTRRDCYTRLVLSFAPVLLSFSGPAFSVLKPRVSKMPRYFLNSVKRQSILIIFSTRHPKET